MHGLDPTYSSWVHTLASFFFGVDFVVQLVWGRRAAHAGFAIVSASYVQLYIKLPPYVQAMCIFKVPFTQGWGRYTVLIHWVNGRNLMSSIVGPYLQCICVSICFQSMLLLYTVHSCSLQDTLCAQG